MTVPLAVSVNGESRQVSAGTTVLDLLRQLSLDPGAGLAVEVNRQIVPRRAHDATILEEGDEIEIVTFVGGG